MKIFSSFSFVIIFLLLSATDNLQGQNYTSYIQEGDIKTLDVKIAWVKGWRPYYECVVLSKEDPRTYTAKELKGYRTTWGNPFISVEVDADEWVFLELIEPGELELYKYVDKEFKSHYYVKTFDSDDFIEVSERRKRRTTRQLEEIWIGCDKFKKLIKDIKFTENYLKRLIRAHNNCNYIHIPKFRKSISLGINSMGLFFSPSRGYDTAIPGGILANIVSSKREMGYMAEFNLSIPIEDSDASFHTGLAVNRWTFNDFSFAGLGEVTYISDINLVDLRIPLGLQYMWPKEKIRPFIIGTLAPHFMISNNSTLTSEIITPNDGILVFTSEQDVSKWGYSGGLAFGLAYHLDDDQIVHIKFGNMTRFNFQKPRVFNVNSFYLAAGYSF